ncbi:hypothetical protein FJW06_15030 [Mesorhizobium sp. B4-1-3]|uniref:hypothetical protein n=1 Tax=Mesorhizobium sp. B4-1-3 TaxID=2589889 RepID=UPI001127DEDF|nr:hypothetical protein [Mesorhizobium sp. B4-1-3]TPI12981.1 hypothetical protein FJW06_15030 [Mesorhizobium sp. B4-1-3]
MLVRWSGPVLTVAGLAVVAALAVFSERTQTSWWVLNSALSPERILPLVGLGIATALMGARPVVFTVAAFLLGEVAGALIYDPYLALMAHVPGATTHAFLTAPFSLLIVGIVLVVSGRFRTWTIPLSALPVGALLAVVTKLTDPTLNDPRIALLGTVVALWVIVAVGLTGRLLRPAWFGIGARILGSWLVAIGLLLGGTAIAAKPPAALPQSLVVPDEGIGTGSYRSEPAPQMGRPRDSSPHDHKPMP